jgi:hypothetical protein
MEKSRISNDVLFSGSLSVEEIKTTGTVSFNDDGLMSKYIAAPRKSEIHITDNNSNKKNLNQFIIHHPNNHKS